MGKGIAVTLDDIAKQIRSADPATKSIRCYEEYEKYFRTKNLEPRSILEVGVHRGESTKVFATRFPAAKIVAIDLEDNNVDFSCYPNIKFIRCNQIDQTTITDIIETEFNGSLDFCIDDGAHIGNMSEITFLTVFPFIKSSGVYIIEDWGTGYLSSWTDGSLYQETNTGEFANTDRKQIHSHSYGMVGFVKSLVDYADGATRERSGLVKSQRVSQIRYLEFTEGMCFVQKH
jgi:23S rRNA U2552 (ribose-2'-O)-methylase RlmE/FtsJ